MTPEQLPEEVTDTFRYTLNLVIQRLRGSEAMARLELTTDTFSAGEERAYMQGVADTFEALYKGLQEELGKFNELTGYEGEDE